MFNCDKQNEFVTYLIQKCLTHLESVAAIPYENKTSKIYAN